MHSRSRSNAKDIMNRVLSAKDPQLEINKILKEILLSNKIKPSRKAKRCKKGRLE